MNIPGVTPNLAATTSIENKQYSQDDLMKNIRKARLERKVLQDPAVLAKLVALETTIVYNTKGEIIPAVYGASLKASK